jgi:hypothetical protein
MLTRSITGLKTRKHRNELWLDIRASHLFDTDGDFAHVDRTPALKLTDLLSQCDVRTYAASARRGSGMLTAPEPCRA